MWASPKLTGSAAINRVNAAHVATNTDSAALYDAVSQIYLEVFPASGVAHKLQGLPAASHIGIAEFHLFSFNHIDATSKWQAEMLKRLV